MKNFTLTYLILLASNILFSQIRIDADFEGANIQIIRINNEKNEIIFRPELKRNQTTRCWFFFKIWNFSKNKPLKLIEVNDRKKLIPTYAVYSYDKIHWSKTQAQTMSDHIVNYSIPTYQYDTIYFATGYPYTYSDLNNFISSIASNGYLDTTILTISEQGIPVPLLVITDTSQKQDKDLVWIIARQHAFEAPSSYCTEGIINFFISNDPLAVKFRKNAIVYIVPMVDVDNVYSGASGRMQKPRDFNRDWDNNPTWKAVQEIIKLMQTTSEVYDFRIFIDIHATFPGTETPVFAYFNLYDINTSHYHNLHNFWLTFASISPIIPSEVSDFSEENYADRYVATRFPYIDFATTVECDWNKTDNGREWTPELWRKSGENIARTIAVYLTKPKAK